MNRLNLLLISLIISSNIISGEKQPEKKERKIQRRTVFDRMRDIERHMEEMFEVHSRMFDDFFAPSSKFKAKEFRELRQIDVKKEGETVVITVHLPDGMKYSDMKIQAKGNNLEGFIDYNDHKFKFFVIRGREFGTSLEYYKEDKQDVKEDAKKTDSKENVAQSSDKKEKKYKQVISSLSTQMLLIPSVSNLENAQAFFEKDTLKIVLPSANSKKDWSNIEVRKPSETKQVEVKQIEVKKEEPKPEIKEVK